MSEAWTLHTDGGARGNPGPAGIGAVLRDPRGNVVSEISQAIGWTTNNVAEYQGLIVGLQVAADQGARSIEVYMDSLLVVQQMKGVFKVKNEGLKPLHVKAKELLAPFDMVRFYAIPREKNAHADRLMNKGIDDAEAAGDFAAPPVVPQQQLF
ncbi:MAG: reverse transcriptase-like protein [Actinomycetota bacterium]|nr:reverse transcriptase-like protein [Actinomycetota bacterium]